jgi:hypothetical protein
MSMWTPVSQEVVSASPQFVATNCDVINQTFTRPADTNAYAQYDAVCNSTSAPVGLVFANAARVNGGSLYITKLEIETNLATCTAQFRLYFFTQAVELTNDNAQYATNFANAAYRVGYIDVPALSTEGTGSGSASAVWVSAPLPCKCAADSRNLYCPAIITRGSASWQPANAQQFYVKIGVDRN